MPRVVISGQAARRLGRAASGMHPHPRGDEPVLDRHGVLDADYEQAAQHNPTLQAVLLPNRTPTPLAGDALVVIDPSAER